MAYNADNAPELEGTLFRDGEWFRENASKSGTPVTQIAKTVLDDEVVYCPVTKRSTNWSRNAPLRAAADPAYDAAMLQMRALLLAPGSMPVMPQHAPLLTERVTKLAMHGGAGRGERFQSARPRQPRLVTHPVPDMVNARVGHRREVEVVVHRKAAMHAVAAKTITRGIAERDALLAARAEADRRRS